MSFLIKWFALKLNTNLNQLVVSIKLPIRKILKPKTMKIPLITGAHTTSNSNSEKLKTDKFELPQNMPAETFRTLEPNDCIGPNAGKKEEYKNPEYYSYHRYSFVDIFQMALKYREEMVDSERVDPNSPEDEQSEEDSDCADKKSEEQPSAEDAKKKENTDDSDKEKSKEENDCNDEKSENIKTKVEVEQKAKPDDSDKK